MGKSQENAYLKLIWEDKNTADDTHNRTSLKNKKKDYGYEGTVHCNNLV